MISYKIIKNSFLLYVRMFVLVVLSLYTTRVLLGELGVEDFGIYSIIWGAILILSFFNNSLSGSIQRFFNIYLSEKEKNKNKLSEIYSCGFLIFIVIGLSILFFSSIFQEYFINIFLNIPEYKRDSAFSIYYIIVSVFIINFLNLHLQSCIVSSEKFTFYSIITILEALLKLISALILVFFDNKLYLYCIFLFISSIFIFLVSYLYCKRKIFFCYFQVVLDVNIYLDIFRFISWSLLGSMGIILSGQGIPLIVNIFIGILGNTAIAIANQIVALIGMIVNNFQKAFTPFLMKSVTESSDLNEKIDILTKISLFFYILVAIPLYLYIDSLLMLWLNNIPVYVIPIVRLLIISMFFEVLSGPLWISIQAHGNIKNYQITVFIISISNLPISYLILLNNFNIYYIWIYLILSNSLLYFSRIFFVNQLIDKKFIKWYFLEIFSKVFSYLMILMLFIYFLYNNIVNFYFFNILFFLGVILFAFFILLNKRQRCGLIYFFKSKLNK